LIVEISSIIIVGKVKSVSVKLIIYDLVIFSNVMFSNFGFKINGGIILFIGFVSLVKIVWR